MIVGRKRNITVKITIMKTLEQILENYKKNTFGSCGIYGLCAYIPYDKLEFIGVELKKDITKEMWNKEIKPLTRENILENLEQDVEYGFEKALGKQKVNTACIFQVVRIWNWILEEGLENWEGDDFDYYGLPLLKATALKYGFYNPIDDDSGREEKYNN